MRIKELDGLRGIFAVMIVFGHLGVFFDVRYDNLILKHTYVFVDYFFCLSGFVISMIYSEEISSNKKLKRFWLKRFIRIYPLHLFVLILYLAGFLTVGYNRGDFGLKFINSVFLTNSTPLLTDQTGINNAAWSISSEMISYFLIGFVFLLFKGLTKKLLASILLICASIVILVALGKSFFSTNDYGFLRGLIGFNFGVITFYLYHNLKGNSFGYTEYLSPIFLLLLFWVIDSNVELPISKGRILISSLLTPLIMSSTILLLLISKKGVFSRFLSSSYIQHLGLISYSIYLTHPFVFNAFEMPFLKAFSSNLWFYFILIPASLIFSNITHHFIEVKLGNYLKSLWIK
jgi:peptidoglycan/LPS O-acetylase OafA/YrhL